MIKLHSKKPIAYIVVIVSLLALGIFSSNVPLTFALTESSNVALVPDSNGLNSHGGYLPTTGFPGGYSPTFTNLHPNSIRDDPTDPIVAGGYDTVVIVMIDYIQNYLSSATFKSRIENFVFNGGKLIIFDSENTHNDYSLFVYPFTANTPGAMGAWSGDMWIVENNTLSHNDTAVYSYLNTATLHDAYDVGDSNVMVTLDPNWCTDMVALNVYGVIGPVQTYAHYGTGLIIWNGYDMDYMPGDGVIANDGNGVHNLNYMWYLMLKQPFNPDNLPCGVKTSGLTLMPSSASNFVGTAHTVTATVRDNLANPISGVVVSFEITSGPNTGMTGSGVTDTDGETTFTWTSAVVGTDTVNATAICPFDPDVTIFDTATKDWIPSQVIPEVPLGTIMASVSMIVALVAYIALPRFRRGSKYLNH